MIIKAIRKGFFQKVRLPGEKFEFPGNKCPKWGVELDKPIDGKSAGMSATDSIKFILTIENEKDVRDFVSAEDRATVLAAAKDRIKKLKVS